MFLEMAPHPKSSYAVRSVMAGFAVVALSACTSTAPAPEPAPPSATETSASSTQLSPSPTQTNAASTKSTTPSNQSPAEPTFTADSIKILEHKIVDDPTAKNLQVKVQAPVDTSFFSGTVKAPCEASVIDGPSAAPSSSVAASITNVTYLLRCQDQNPTTELAASISYKDFELGFVIPLK